MHVLVVSNNASEKFYNKVILTRALKNRGISFQCINVTQSFVSDGYLFFIRERVRKPDLILMCNTIPIPYWLINATNLEPNSPVTVYNFLKDWDVPSFNNIVNHTRAADKWTMFNIINNANIATPNSFTIPKDYNQALDLVNNILKFPVVAKTVDGYAANGVYLIEDEQDLNAFFRFRVKGERSLFLQEYVAGAEGCLHCVCVVGNDIKTTLRIGSPSLPRSFAADTEAGRVQIAIKTSDEVRDLSVRTMQALGLDYARIDIIRDISGKYKVLEVNTPGGLNLPDVTFNCDTGQLVVDLMLKKYS